MISSSNTLKSKEEFWSNTLHKNKFEVTKFGRCINVSYGLIIGLVIDKTILVLLPKMYKFISLAIPPFSVTLMSKGKVLFRIRFDRKFNRLFERFLGHMVTK